ncbi:MAG: DUF4199 family protein [Cytophagales bacterium]|nr:DUF4199 family protein [Cytophagales bacterium]
MRNKLTKYAVKYGLTGGAFASLILAGFYFIDPNPVDTGRTLLHFAVLPVFLLFGMLEFRSSLPSQTINYPKAIFVTSLIAFLTSGIYTASEYSLMRFSPDKFETAKESYIKEWESKKEQIEEDQGEAFYSEQLEGRKKIGLTDFALVSGTVSTGVWALIWTITCSLMVSIWDQKKRKKITDQN